MACAGGPDSADTGGLAPNFGCDFLRMVKEWLSSCCPAALLSFCGLHTWQGDTPDDVADVALQEQSSHGLEEALIVPDSERSQQSGPSSGTLGKLRSWPCIFRQEVNIVILYLPVKLLVQSQSKS